MNGMEVLRLLLSFMREGAKGFLHVEGGGVTLACFVGPLGVLLMMSDRERWIVYPLLVLSLALGIKGRWDAWRGESEFNVVTCRTLLVKNELNEPQAVLQQNDQGAAELSLAGAGGLVEASLIADEGGGRLLLMRRADQKAIVLGHDKMLEASGLWAIDRSKVSSALLPLEIDAGDDQVWEILPWPLPDAANQQSAKPE